MQYSGAAKRIWPLLSGKMPIAIRLFLCMIGLLVSAADAGCLADCGNRVAVTERQIRVCHFLRRGPAQHRSDRQAIRNKIATARRARLELSFLACALGAWFQSICFDDEVGTSHSNHRRLFTERRNVSADRITRPTRSRNSRKAQKWKKISTFRQFELAGRYAVARKSAATRRKDK